MENDELRALIDDLKTDQTQHRQRLAACEAVLMALIDRIDPRLIREVEEVFDQCYLAHMAATIPAHQHPEEWAPLRTALRHAVMRVGKQPPPITGAAGPAAPPPDR